MDKRFIAFLAKNKAIKFGEFQLKSGRLSPYFINIGSLYYGESSYLLGQFFAKRILKQFGQDFDLVFGPAYKGIPLAVSTSIALSKKFRINKGWVFDRKEEKAYGDKGAYVGAPLVDGAKVVIVDDVFTTGGTKEDAIARLKATAHVKIKGIVIAVDRQEKGESRNAIEEFTEKTGVNVYSIVTISEIFKHLRKHPIDGTLLVNDDLYRRFSEYRKMYG